MMDPFSATAGIVGLASAALQLTQELYSLISRFRRSSMELQGLSRELEDLTEVMAQIQRWKRTYSSSSPSNNASEAFSVIQVGLQTLLEDIGKIKDAIEKCVPRNDTVFGRVRTRVRSFLSRGEIFEMAARLMHHKTTLHLAVSVISGYNTNNTLSHISHQINSLHEFQRAFHNEMDGSTAEICTQLDSIQLNIRSLGRPPSELPTIFEKEQGKTTTVLRGSNTHGIIALNNLSFDLHRLLLPSTIETQPLIDKKLALWFLSELHAVLADALAVEASRQENTIPPDPASPTLQNSSLKPFESRRLSTALSLDTFRPTMQEGLLPLQSFPQPRSRIAFLNNVTVATEIPIGNLIITVKMEHYKINKREGPRAVITTGRLLFVPSTEASLTGVAVIFVKGVDTLIKIPRSLSTFGVHPNDAPIFGYLQTKNFTAVEDMLVTRTVSVNDRDEDGNSLFWYTIHDSYDFNLCRLLIQHGADPSDCNKYGDHALALLVSKLPGSTSAKVPEDLRSLIRLLIKQSSTEAYSTCRYKRRKSIQQAPASLLHCLMGRRSSRTPVLELVIFFLSQGFDDLDARDVNGNTPLLYALYYMRQSELVAVAFALIEAGADILAVNNHDEGALHLLFRRLSACNNYEMSSENYEALVRLINRLLEQCELTSENIVGYTPLDAALSPTAWPLLCKALAETGNDVRDEILAIDDRRNIIQLDADLQEGFSQLLARREPSNTESPKIANCEAATEQLCFFCDHRSGTTKRGAPFDEFCSMLVDELGSSIHMVACNHFIAGGECLNVREEDSSCILDYHPVKMTDQAAGKRSWKRHMAYLLWRDGGLRSPVEFQEWAAGGGYRRISTAKS